MGPEACSCCGIVTSANKTNGRKGGTGQSARLQLTSFIHKNMRRGHCMLEWMHRQTHKRMCHVGDKEMENEVESAHPQQAITKHSASYSQSKILLYQWIPVMERLRTHKHLFRCKTPQILPYVACWRTLWAQACYGNTGSNYVHMFGSGQLTSQRLLECLQWSGAP